MNYLILREVSVGLDTTTSGCFYNVMGFPMHRFALELAELMGRDEIVFGAAESRPALSS